MVSPDQYRTKIINETLCTAIIVSCAPASVSIWTLWTALILIELIKFGYFYGSTVPRPNDGIEDTKFDYWLVHLFVPYAIINIVNDFANIILTTDNVLCSTVTSIFLLLLAIYIGDFTAGFVHFLGDVTQDYHFIYHHEDPVFICSKSYVHHTCNSYYLAIPIYFVLGYLLNANYVLWTWIQCVIMVAVQGNECHHYAHCQKKQIGPIITWLQKYNLFISALTHHDHHKKPYNKNYCTVTGWANPLLNLITVPVCNSNYIKKKYPIQKPATKETYNPFH
jgi:hypothetical protein